MAWLNRTGKRADVLSDDDLEAYRSGDALARAYDLVVFPGHEEYTTAHAYDVLRRYRDLGGNLMFLSANNLFWKVRRTGSRLVRVRKWRDLGRPESALVGVQYVASNHGEHQEPLYRDGRGGGAVGVRRHRARRRRPARGALRDRDRRARGRLAARDEGAGADPRPDRAWHAPPR